MVLSRLLILLQSLALLDNWLLASTTEDLCLTLIPDLVVDADDLTRVVEVLNRLLTSLS